MSNNVAISIRADVADLVAKRAIMSEQLKLANKDLRSFAQAAQTGGATTELRQGMLASATAVSSARAQIAALDKSVKALAQTQQAAAGMTNAQRAGMQQFGYQAGDIITMANLGARPMQIFASQIGQVVQATQLMAGGTSKFATFLGGPWGIAAAVGVQALVPLVAKLFEGSDAVSDETAKLEENARQALATARAKDAFARSEEGARDSVRNLTEDLKEQNDALRTRAELLNRQAHQDLATLQTSQAADQDRLARLSASPSKGNFSERNRLREAIAERSAEILQAERNLLATRADLAEEAARRIVDPVAGIRRAYDGPDGLITKAKQAAVAEGAVTAATRDRIAALIRERDAKIEAEQARQRTPRQRAAPAGPSIVSQWAQQLQDQQIASDKLLADQTAGELAFWQSKVALTRQGSREWLDVQGRIFRASQTLAREAFAERIAISDAELNEARGNWAATRAIWDRRLATIAEAHTEESAEYRRAQREFASAQRRHEEEMADALRQSREREVGALRQHLDALRGVREQEAAATAQLVRDQAEGSPFGEIGAAQAVLEQHRQLGQQRLVDLETVYAAQAQLLDDAIVDAAAKYGQDSAAYIAAVDAKKAADQEYYDQRAAMEADLRAQAIQDVLAVKAAYQSSMSSIVEATSSGVVGMLARTQSFAQAAGGVYNSLVGVVDQVLQRMLTRWITTHVLMSAEQKAQLAVQVASHAGAESLKVAATGAGQAGQILATMSGSEAKAMIVGASNAAEINSDAATAAAAAYKAMAGVPVIGPALGAAAAATTFAAVSGFGKMAKFDGGADRLGRDQIALVHAGERIVPTRQNDKLSAMIDRGALGANRSTNVTNHYTSNINAGAAPRDVISEIEKRQQHFIRMFERWIRDGKVKVP